MEKSEPGCLSKLGPGGGKWLYMDKTLSCVKYTGESKINMYNVSQFKDENAAKLQGIWSKNSDGSWTNGKLTMKLGTKPDKQGNPTKDKKGNVAKFLVIDLGDIRLYSKEQKEGGAPFHSGDNDFTGEKDGRMFKAVAKGHEHFCADENGYS